MNTRRLFSTSRAACQRGLSLVEMMVGIAVGLFIVAGATLVVTTQLGDNRRLLIETQLQQDLRATGDVITRELRRSGGVGEDTISKFVWVPGALATQAEFNDITISESGSQVDFGYRRDTVTGPWGFKLDGGVIKTFTSDAWQSLTDTNTMEVTLFTVQPIDSLTEVIPCPRGCGGDPTDTSCWPTVSIRNYEVRIEAQSRTDASVRRALRSQVRVRNDAVNFSSSSAPACPT
jgi:prepilin-type N-terminal cleavage/methylation domain-containing protein